MMLRNCWIVFVSGLMGLLACLGASSGVQAADDTGQEGKVIVGFRAGLALPTQEIVDNTNTGVGPAINLLATYGLNKWINIGSMLAWQRLSMDVESPKSDLASLHTVTLLPLYMEYRPGQWGEVQPYLSTGIGVNFNSASESDAVKSNNVTLSPGNTFAWRLAGGLDFAITQHVLLNTEFAMNRNRGTIETQQGGTTSDSPFDATSMNVLFGVKYLF